MTTDPTGCPPSHDEPAGPAISVVVPLLDEAESLPHLHPLIIEAFDARDEPYEVIYLNDGSRDATASLIDELAAKDERVRALHFRINQGKAAGYTAGFAHARGDIVVTMDGDLQDDPAEADKLIRRLREGYDCVSGWKHRGKGPVGKRLPSYLFNAVVSWLSGITLHDFNCPFKAYRTEAARSLRLTGDLYRFIPLLLAVQGHRVTEERIENHPRRFGHSKYGASRFLGGFLDLLTVLFVTKYSQRPLRLFGSLGAASFGTGFAIDTVLTYRGLFVTGHIGHFALLGLGVFLMLLGVQLTGMGLLGELVIVRTAAAAPEVRETGRAARSDKD